MWSAAIKQNGSRLPQGEGCLVPVLAARQPRFESDRNGLLEAQGPHARGAGQNLRCALEGYRRCTLFESRRMLELLSTPLDMRPIKSTMLQAGVGGALRRGPQQNVPLLAQRKLDDAILVQILQRQHGTLIGGYNVVHTDCAALYLPPGLAC